MVDTVQTNETSATKPATKVPPAAPKKDEPPKLAAAENQIIAVAKAMDIDDKLNWDSTDHDKIVARENAKVIAKQMILGVQAVGKMPAAETEEAAAESKAASKQPTQH
jgi:hypothetical protein